MFNIFFNVLLIAEKSSFVEYNIYTDIPNILNIYFKIVMGAAKKFNTNKMHTFQSTTLRIITNVSFYVSNHTLQTNLRINTIEEISKILYIRFRSRLSGHSNPLIYILDSDTILSHPPRWLNRKWCRDLKS
jgi:hypothetical protein